MRVVLDAAWPAELTASAQAGGWWLGVLAGVETVKRLPVVVDDAFGTLEPAKRALIAKMLKGIATQTQVIHRVIEPPPAGTADLVLQA